MIIDRIMRICVASMYSWIDECYCGLTWIEFHDARRARRQEWWLMENESCLCNVLGRRALTDAKNSLLKYWNRWAARLSSPLTLSSPLKQAPASPWAARSSSLLTLSSPSHPVPKSFQNSTYHFIDVRDVLKRAVLSRWTSNIFLYRETAIKNWHCVTLCSTYPKLEVPEYLLTALIQYQ
jgi:hypothetical protein